MGKTASGENVFQGSHGGHYRMDSKSNNKVYLKDFVGDKIVGKTKDGKAVHEGPRGGHYTVTETGTKEYIYWR